jgi:hypothetical protein
MQHARSQARSVGKFMRHLQLNFRRHRFNSFKRRTAKGESIMSCDRVEPAHKPANDDSIGHTLGAIWKDIMSAGVHGLRLQDQVADAAFGAAKEVGSAAVDLTKAAGNQIYKENQPEFDAAGRAAKTVGDTVVSVGSAVGSAIGDGAGAAADAAASAARRVGGQVQDRPLTSLAEIAMGGALPGLFLIDSLIRGSDHKKV